MKTNVIYGIAFAVGYSDYNTPTVQREVSWRELLEAPVGTEFYVDHNSNCIRGVVDERATVVYRDDHGAAVLFRTIRTSDGMDARALPDELELVWFEF